MSIVNVFQVVELLVRFSKLLIKFFWKESFVPELFFPLSFWIFKMTVSWNHLKTWKNFKNSLPNADGNNPNTTFWPTNETFWCLQSSRTHVITPSFYWGAVGSFFSRLQNPIYPGSSRRIQATSGSGDPLQGKMAKHFEFGGTWWDFQASNLSQLLKVYSGFWI